MKNVHFNRVILMNHLWTLLFQMWKSKTDWLTNEFVIIITIITCYLLLLIIISKYTSYLAVKRSYINLIIIIIIIYIMIIPILQLNLNEYDYCIEEIDYRRLISSWWFSPIRLFWKWRNSNTIHRKHKVWWDSIIDTASNYHRWENIMLSLFTSASFLLLIRSTTSRKRGGVPQLVESERKMQRQMERKKWNSNKWPVK